MSEFDKILELKLGIQTYNWGKVSSQTGPQSLMMPDSCDIPGGAGQ